MEDTYPRRANLLYDKLEDILFGAGIHDVRHFQMAFGLVNITNALIGTMWHAVEHFFEPWLTLAGM